MCGIAGILDFSASALIEEQRVRQMIQQLATRGPDAAGYYFGSGIALGHARLSIIDLTGGTQPIHNEDRSIWTVFNGEIFNYLELRQDLERAGHRFYTETDTEVIVHLYEEYGIEFVHHLNGQFAIALWDERNRRLCLIRDRPGILPLFFSRQRNSVVFGSEVKALLPTFSHPPELDPQALKQIFTLWVPLSPRTIFKNVEEVAPGEMVVIENRRLRPRS